jgi:hypothetical protein
VHGAPHGTAPHFADPQSDASSRGTKAAPLEQTLMLIAGVFIGYANSHRALITLYGWEVSRFDLVTETAAQRLLQAVQQ